MGVQEVEVGSLAAGSLENRKGKKEADLNVIIWEIFGSMRYLFASILIHINCMGLLVYS
jgi:hypothetical protein